MYTMQEIYGKITFFYFFKVCKGKLLAFLAVGVIAGIYRDVYKIQHNHMYDKVEDAGFTKEITEDFIERYQGYYALTENGVDYLVEPKSIGKYELDTDNFVLTARKDDMDITINIDKNRKLYLALYPQDIEIDEQGNVINTSEDLTDVQKEHLDNLLADRENEILPMLAKGVPNQCLLKIC